MAKKGHVVVFNWGDDNAWETDFRHPDLNPNDATLNGDSPNWIDNVNFVFFSDHGGLNESDQTTNIAFSKNHEYPLSTSDRWKLGVNQLKWMALNSCDAVLNTDPNHIAAVWFPPAYGIHMIFGFIGASYGGDDYIFRDLGKDFGTDAANCKPLANAWLDAGTSFWDVEGNSPIVLAYGQTENDAIARRENETIEWLNVDVCSPDNPKPMWIAWKYRRD
jgi:hypothetical protein